MDEGGCSTHASQKRACTEPEGVPPLAYATKGVSFEKISGSENGGRMEPRCELGGDAGTLYHGSGAAVCRQRSGGRTRSAVHDPGGWGGVKKLLATSCWLLACAWAGSALRISGK